MTTDPLNHSAGIQPATMRAGALDPMFAVHTLDALGDAVIATDRRGRILYWNDAAEELTGWSADAVVGRSILDAVAAEGLREAAAKALERVRAGGEWSGELQLRHRRGDVPVHVRMSGIRDEAGTLLGIVGVPRDISDQRRVERDLEDRELRLDLLHRATPTLQREWTIEDHRLRWRGAADQVLGVPESELGDRFRWWEERIHPRDRERVTTGLWDAVAGGRKFWTDEYGFQRGDGSYATVFDRAYVVMAEGRPASVVATMIDMSEPRRLRENQRLLAQVSMMLDLSLDYRSTLPGICRLMVHDFADYFILAIGEPGASFDGVWAEHGDPAMQPVLDELTTALEQIGPDAVMADVHDTGRARLIPVVAPDLFEPTSRGAVQPWTHERLERLDPRSLIAIPLSVRGDILGVAVFARSRHGAPYVSDDMPCAEELGRRIALTMDNARLSHAAEMAHRTKSDFLAVMSHELRTPLTAVLGYADLLSTEVSGPLSEKQRHQVERIKVGSDRLLGMIEAILAYARLETGSERAHLEPVPVEEIVERVRIVTAAYAREKESSLVARLEHAPDILRADRDKVTLILVALVTNAFKFGGTEDVVLRITSPGGRVHFDVEDRGTGIAEAHLPHIFNPFWQPERPATRRVGGAGLGLSLARRLARLMDGDVAVADTSPAGTTVRLTLPATARD